MMMMWKQQYPNLAKIVRDLRAELDQAKAEIAALKASPKRGRPRKKPEAKHVVQKQAAPAQDRDTAA